MSQFPKSKGALFLNAQKAGEKHPDLRGHLLITAEQIQMLVKMGQSGGKVQLQVAGWQRVSQAGAAYIYLEGEAYIKIADQSQPQGYAQPQAAPQMMPQQPMQQQPMQQPMQQQLAQPTGQGSAAVMTPADLENARNSPLHQMDRQQQIANLNPNANEMSANGAGAPMQSLGFAPDKQQAGPSLQQAGPSQDRSQVMQELQSNRALLQQLYGSGGTGTLQGA